MSCDIIIPVWNELKFTKECIESIVKNTHYPYRLIIIDNGSDHKTALYLRGLSSGDNVHLVRNDDNLGFVRAVNEGLGLSRSPYICIMNNDTVAADGWLSEMIDVADKDKRIGLVNPSSNNLGQHKGSESIDKYAATLRQFKGQYIEMGSCIGFCMLIKRELFERIGYLDEVYKEGNFDDTDYSRRAEKEGYLSVRAKGAYVYHHMKRSFLKIKGYEESFRKNQEVFNRRWGRPKRLLYIVTKRHGKLFDWMREDILKKARGGNWVWLFFSERDAKKSDGLLEMTEHSNIKVVNLPSAFFELNCIIRVLKKKKKFDSIYVDNENLIKRIKKYDKFHKAETMPIGG